MSAFDTFRSPVRGIEAGESETDRLAAAQRLSHSTLLPTPSPGC
jgi:hypothetical protein